MAKKGKQIFQLPETVYWRYKKNQAPIDEYAHLNGAVKVIKPATKLDRPKLK
jgi:hypothetical protein